MMPAPSRAGIERSGRRRYSWVFFLASHTRSRRLKFPRKRSSFFCLVSTHPSCLSSPNNNGACVRFTFFVGHYTALGHVREVDGHERRRPVRGVASPRPALLRGHHARHLRPSTPPTSRFRWGERWWNLFGGREGKADGSWGLWANLCRTGSQSYSRHAHDNSRGEFRFKRCSFFSTFCWVYIPLVHMRVPVSRALCLSLLPWLTLDRLGHLDVHCHRLIRCVLPVISPQDRW